MSKPSIKTYTIVFKQQLSVINWKYTESSIF